MRIALFRRNNKIIAIKDYEDIKDRAEITHLIAELESIKLDLIYIFDNYEEEGDNMIIK